MVRRLVVLLALSTLGAACASDPWNVQHFALAHGTYTQRTAPDRIDVYRAGGAAPARAHVEIAQISVREAPLHAPSTAPLSIDLAVAQARERAAALGADALKDVRIQVAPTGVYGAGSVSVDAIAIRWR